MVSSSVILVAGLAMLGSSTTSAFTTFPSRHRSTAAAAARSSSPAGCDGRACRHSAAVAVGVVGRRRAASPLRMSTAEEAPAAVAVQDETSGSGAQQPTRDIPTTLPSECGIDYVPLATMLATGDLKGADQFTRDALIKAAGAGSQKREFVYWTEVKNIPK